MKPIRIEDSLNGWINIVQMNPLILHITLWEDTLNKAINCWLDQDAVDFLMTTKSHVLISSIVLRGQYTGKYQFKAHAYCIHAYLVRNSNIIKKLDYTRYDVYYNRCREVIK